METCFVQFPFIFSSWLFALFENTYEKETRTESRDGSSRDKKNCRRYLKYHCDGPVVSQREMHLRAGHAERILPKSPQNNLTRTNNAWCSQMHPIHANFYEIFMKRARCYARSSSGVKQGLPLKYRYATLIRCRLSDYIRIRILQSQTPPEAFSKTPFVPVISLPTCIYTYACLLSRISACLPQ